ncbi:MAG: nuclear transport factor 2 family protein [Halobacteriales archaeon]
MVDIDATVRRYYRLVDEGSYDDLVRLFAEDVRYERPGQGAIEGREALLRFYEEGRPLSEGEHAVDAVVVDGDVAAVRGRFVGRQAGERVAFGFADFHEFEGDLIARRYTFTDRDEV